MRCHSLEGGGPESLQGSHGAVVGSRALAVLLFGQLVVSIPVEKGHQGRQSGGANTDSFYGPAIVYVHWVVRIYIWETIPL